jgi:hypothetical protein
MMRSSEHQVETFTQRKRRNDRDFNTPLFPPQNEDFAEMRLAMIQTSLEPEDVEEPEKPRSQEEEDDLDLFGGGKVAARATIWLARPPDQGVV